jgi:hypothetical protein
VSNSASFLDCYFYYLTNTKKFEGMMLPNVMGDIHDDYLCDQQRYENIASWVMSIIAPLPRKGLYILIEDYAFAAKGRVFALAENCGLLKYLLYKEGYQFFTVPPSVIKKHATQKGNADKQKMHDAFKELTEVDLGTLFWGPKGVRHEGKLLSPVTDIVDAYYLSHYMRHSLDTKNMEKIYGADTRKGIDHEL